MIQDKSVRLILNSFDASICYDCVGTLSQADMADVWKVPVINILMDHPMSFGYCMKNPPRKYIQLSPDKNHVMYAKHFFGINNAFFLPHMASINTRFERVSIENKTIEVLFPGTMMSCNDMYQQIKDQWPQDNMKVLVLEIIEFLLCNPSATVEEAMGACLEEGLGATLSDQLIATFLKYSKKIDVFIRMYFRTRVVKAIVETGVSMTIIGGGWEKLWKEKPGNVTVLPGTSFAGIFPYMERAKITLTVMPWFKAGTHDRNFNALMHFSCPLTDTSSWMLKNFKPDKECAYYSLEHLDELPYVVYRLLNHPELQELIVVNGRRKVENNYTSKQTVEKILYYLKECYGIG